MSQHRVSWSAPPPYSRRQFTDAFRDCTFCLLDSFWFCTVQVLLSMKGIYLCCQLATVSYLTEFIEDFCALNFKVIRSVSQHRVSWSAPPPYSRRQFTDAFRDCTSVCLILFGSGQSRVCQLSTVSYLTEFIEDFCVLNFKVILCHSTE